jgi:hypothetical protein
MEGPDLKLELKQSLLLSSADLHALVQDKLTNIQKQADLETLRAKLEKEFSVLKEELSLQL